MGNMGVVLLVMWLSVKWSLKKPRDGLKDADNARDDSRKGNIMVIKCITTKHTRSL